jgi:hypothetical protein
VAQVEWVWLIQASSKHVAKQSKVKSWARVCKVDWGDSRSRLKIVVELSKAKWTYMQARMILELVRLWPC